MTAQPYDIAPCHLKTHTELLELIEYDQYTGEFTILDTDRCYYNAKRDKLLIDSKAYLLERLAWFYVTKKYPTSAIRFTLTAHRIPHEEVERLNLGKTVTAPDRSRYAFSNLKRTYWEPRAAKKREEYKAMLEPYKALLEVAIANGDKEVKVLTRQEETLKRKHKRERAAHSAKLRKAKQSRYNHQRRYDAAKRRGFAALKPADRITMADVAKSLDHKELLATGNAPEQIKQREKEAHANKVRLGVERGDNAPMQDRADVFVQRLLDAQKVYERRKEKARIQAEIDALDEEPVIDADGVEDMLGGGG